MTAVVVLCAANNWDDVRLADRPLAEALLEHAPVLYVDPPLSHLSVRHNPRLTSALDGERLQEVLPGLHRLTPVVPPRPFAVPVLPLSRHIVRRRVRAALAELDAQPRAIVSTFLLVDVFDLAPDAFHLYWVQDDVASGARLWGLDMTRLVRAEAHVAARADIVLTSSPLAGQRWRTAGYAVHDLPNGCDVSRFIDPTAPRQRVTPNLPGPVAVFVGHLNGRTDLDLLLAVVEEGLSLLLIGPVSSDLQDPRLSRLLAHPRVRAVGPQPYEDLPAWTDVVDVGLVPYRRDEFNRYSFPLKTLEYLAAGLPVVSTTLPANTWLDCPHITERDEPKAFAAAAREAACARHDRSLVGQRRAFAAGHSWAHRAADLADLVGLRGHAPSVRSDER